MSGGWRRLWLVARREWNQRVRSLAFRISTILSILFVVALIAIPEIYGGDEEARTVGLVGDRAPDLPAALRASGDQLGLTVKTRAFADEPAGRDAVRAGDVSVLLVDQRELSWRDDVDDELRAAVTVAVQVVERQAAIDELALIGEEAQRLLDPVELRSTSLEPVTEERTARMDLAWIVLALLFMAIAFYGGFVLMGVVEEKSSRVVEVLLSRLRPSELLGGKILGIGLVGLAQIAAVVAAALVALGLSENTLAPETTPSTMAWIVVWFVLGYAFYSVLYATAGSLVSRQEEAQGIQFPISALMLVTYFLSMEAAQTPDGGVALVGSFLPPTAPMVMTVRIAHGGVPWWHVGLAVASVAATVYGLVVLAGRIYSGAALRFGGRLRLNEAWRGGEA